MNKEIKPCDVCKLADEGCKKEIMSSGNLTWLTPVMQDTPDYVYEEAANWSSLHDANFASDGSVNCNGFTSKMNSIHTEKYWFFYDHPTATLESWIAQAGDDPADASQYDFYCEDFIDFVKQNGGTVINMNSKYVITWDNGSGYREWCSQAQDSREAALAAARLDESQLGSATWADYRVETVKANKENKDCTYTELGMNDPLISKDEEAPEPQNFF